MKEIQTYKITGEAQDHEWILKHRNLIEQEMRIELQRNDPYSCAVLDMPTELNYWYSEPTKTFKYNIKMPVVKTDSRNATGYIAAQQLLVDLSGNQVTVV